jgi:photosystem II stability/assembly factor-like uncharacterized protein
MHHTRRKFIYVALGASASLVLPAIGRGQRRPSLWEAVYKFPHHDGGSRALPAVESLCFADAGYGWAVGGPGLLLRTDDGGRNWWVSWLGEQVNPAGVFFLDSARGWLVGNRSSAGVVLGTRDGGSSWTPLARVEGFELSALHDVWFADERRGWAVGEAQRAGAVRDLILQTTDGGATWAMQYLGVGTYLHRVQFSDAQHGWAVGDGGILRTSDGGAVWRRQPAVARKVSFTGLDVLSRDEAWVVGPGGIILHTTDGGQSWASPELPAGYAGHHLSSVKFIGPERGWVAGDGGAVFSTKDGGLSWELERVKQGEYLRTLAATSEGLFAAGDSGVILTRRLH